MNSENLETRVYYSAFKYIERHAVIVDMYACFTDYKKHLTKVQHGDLMWLMISKGGYVYIKEVQ